MSFGPEHLSRETVLLQRLQRWRRGFIEWRFVALHRCQRLSGLCPKSRCDFGDRADDLLLSGHLDLLLIDDGSAAAVDGAEAEHVLRAEAGYRAGEQRSAVCSVADFARYIAGQRRGFGTAHHWQGPLDSV